MGWESGIGAAEARSALAWWLEAGVDVPVQDEPRNWLAGRAPAAEPASPAPAPTEPRTLAEFQLWLAASPTLPLAAAGGRRILPLAAEQAPVMLVADLPGPEEALEGRPIAGDAWQLTSRMLAAIGILADDAHVAPLACFSVPGLRPSPADLAACADLVRRQVVLARPKRLLLLGDAPARALLGKPLRQAREHVQRIEGVRAVATFAPRWLLNRPTDKALAWRDLLLLMEDEA